MYALLSESEGEYLWDGLSNELKEAFLGMMTFNDLAENVYGAIAAELEVFGRVGLASALAVSNMRQNGFIARPTAKKNIKGDKVSIFVDMPEELRITLMITAVKLAPVVQKLNHIKMNRCKEKKREQDKLVMMEGWDKVTDCLIQCSMWDSDRAWKNIAQVRNGVKALKFKKDKETGLKDNT